MTTFGRRSGPPVHRAPIGIDGKSEADVRAMLRMAQLAFEEVQPAWEKAVGERGWAAWVAFQAGMSDAMIAEVYGVPRANVERMRQRVMARLAVEGGEETNMRAEV